MPNKDQYKKECIGNQSSGKTSTSAHAPLKTIGKIVKIVLRPTNGLTIKEDQAAKAARLQAKNKTELMHLNNPNNFLENSLKTNKRTKTS